MCDACVMHTCTGLVGTKTGKVKRLLVFKPFLKGPRGPKHTSRTNKYPRNGVFGAFRGHFELTLSISTSNCMCDACVMHTCTGLVGPKTGKVKKVLVFKAFLNGQRGDEYSREVVQMSGRSGFGVILGSFWGQFGIPFDG